ncbi:hypothetical protein BC937DRAFT_86617 [Endogone sp. FLAS-F59071]|nr:hypothetical protein BC937DRAFT_86617 [Endogone sp. FLAS-F59071]|eukprot:RUS19975.1 hypothetical protein BC937DRAFT_86617 [Endogone sp. FLAS-F59071]
MSFFSSTSSQINRLLAFALVALVAAVIIPRVFYKDSNFNLSNDFIGEDALVRLEQEFNLSQAKLSGIHRHFAREMRKGLERHGATMPMIPTFITNSVTGKEQGEYMALDMGGTNLRVCRVVLEGAGQLSVEQETFVIPAELKVGSINDMFDWVVSCVETFFEHKGHPLKPEEEAISTNILYIGIILGTGTNAAYYETRDALEKWGTLAHEDPNLDFTEMIINTEWSNFDGERVVLPVTRYDHDLDTATNDAGTSIFEKLISGMYLGEIARLILADLHAKGRIFAGLSLGADAEAIRRAVAEPYIFTSEYISLIVDDTTLNLATVAQVLADFLSISAASIPLADLTTVRAVCSLVGTRAARLSAVGVAAIFTQRPELLEQGDGSTVAVDGSLFENYPGWVEIMQETLIRLLGKEKANRIRLRLVKDGSGVGAAIVAMLAAQQQQQRTFRLDNCTDDCAYRVDNN